MRVALKLPLAARIADRWSERFDSQSSAFVAFRNLRDAISARRSQGLIGCAETSYLPEPLRHGLISSPRRFDHSLYFIWGEAYRHNLALGFALR